MAAKKIALFIDADNVSAKFGKQIIDELSRRGEIFIRRIYGNWEKSILHGWNECILNFSLRAVQQTDFVAGKNATDMSLTIDAMDVLYGGRADIFALVSNDSDFTPLAIRLREGGINVLGLGNGHAANSFRMACSEFIDLDAPPVEEKFPTEQISKPVKKKSASKENSPVQLNLFDDEKKVVELKPPTSPPEKISSPKVVTPAQVQPVVKVSPVTNPKVVSLSERQLQSERDKKIQKLHDILRETAQIHGGTTGFLLLNFAGQEIKQQNLGYGVKDFGFGTLRNFVEAFPKLYEVQTTNNQVSYRCKTSDTAEQKLRQLHDIFRDTAKVHADTNGFADLSRAGNALSQKNLSIKGSGYSTLQKFIAAFPKLYEIKKSGKIIRYRCREK
ncbi:MAG: NYN domain-containing protein [Selenomonadaceae bacterium]|nr:NYN domain-containing protein [Selenomonadaceae bacterium]